MLILQAYWLSYKWNLCCVVLMLKICESPCVFPEVGDVLSKKVMDQNEGLKGLTLPGEGLCMTTKSRRGLGVFRDSLMALLSRAALLACVGGLAFLIRACLRWFPALVSDCHACLTITSVTPTTDAPGVYSSVTTRNSAQPCCTKWEVASIGCQSVEACKHVLLFGQDVQQGCCSAWPALMVPIGLNQQYA